MAYSDTVVGEALIRLAVNKYDFDKTAKETGFPAQTLRRWNKNVPKKGVGDLLERAIERMLMHIPTDWSGSNWAIAIGILMDKWLLMQGEPTSRTETIGREVAAMNPTEKDELIVEVKDIIARAKSRANGSGSPG
jgi:hypothetical protein